MTVVQLVLASRSKVSALVQMKMLFSTVLDSVSSFPGLDDGKFFCFLLTLLEFSKVLIGRATILDHF